MLFEYDRFWMAIVQVANHRAGAREERKKQEKWFWLFDLVADCLTLKIFNKIFTPKERRAAEKRDVQDGLSAVMAHLEKQVEQQVVLREGKWDVGWILGSAIPVPAGCWIADWIKPYSIAYLEAFCPECGEAYKAEILKTEMWSEDAGPLATASGRKLQCPRGHTVLEVWDYES